MRIILGIWAIASAIWIGFVANVTLTELKYCYPEPSGQVICWGSPNKHLGYSIDLLWSATPIIAIAPCLIVLVIVGGTWWGIKIARRRG